MIAWKIYAVVFSGISILSGLGRLFLFFKKPGSVSRLDLFSGFYNFFMLPGIFGYAWQRAIGWHLAWIFGIVVLLCLNIAELLEPKMQKVRHKIGLPKFLLMLAGMIALGAPALYALIRYACFSPTLWT